MVSAHDVAQYFLTRSEPEEGDFVSNLKLQKLLYYAQGFHIALCDEPLFTEAICAWDHGPVVPDVYHAYKKHGAGGIPVPMTFAANSLDSEVRDLLNEIWSVFGQFSAWKLRNMTHEEPPWLNTPGGSEISHQVLKEYFETQITG